MEIQKKFTEPLVLELVPEDDHVHLVRVQKCPPKAADTFSDLNQRGKDAWPEITMWPRGMKYRLYHGEGTIHPISGERPRWSIKLWPIEQYIYDKQIKREINKALDELPLVKPYPRKGKQSDDYDCNPRPEDFGPRWYAELQEMKHKQRRMVRHMKSGSILDKVTHAAAQAGLYKEVQDEPTTQQTPTKTTTVPSPTPTVVHSYIGANVSSMAAPTTGSTGDQLYQKLLSKTNPENLPNLSRVVKLAKPLEGIISDPNLRMKAAFAQAADQGVTVDSVLREIESLFTTLEQELGYFNNVVQGKQSEIVSKEEQLKRLSVDVAQSKAHLDEAIAGFDSAHSRRQNELTALKSQFSSLK